MGLPRAVPYIILGTSFDIYNRHGCEHLWLAWSFEAMSREEFLSLDQNGDGRLSMEEFEQAIRDRCNIFGDEPTPMHLPHVLGLTLA